MTVRAFYMPVSPCPAGIGYEFLVGAVNPEMTAAETFVMKDGKIVESRSIYEIHYASLKQYFNMYTLPILFVIFAKV